jgi:hypothetical protein
MKSSTDTPHFLGLRTTIYHAPDLAKAKSWYSKILRFEPYFDQPFYVGGYELGLDPNIHPRPQARAVSSFTGVSPMLTRH